ncbi:MAG: PKD domain-containing protein [Bacteroidales bacterium]|nr:PKD domain-containing protein [Bacteroidales bacterium]
MTQKKQILLKQFKKISFLIASVTLLLFFNNCRKDPVKGFDFFYEAPPQLKIKSVDAVIKNCEPPYPVTYYQVTENILGHVSYFWDFGDGTTSTDQNPTRIYPTLGDYTVTLIVKNELGSDTFNLPMPELNQTSIPVQAGFSFSHFNNNNFAPNKIIFKNTSSGANQFMWHFGDGNQSNNDEPNHVFNNPGTYTVKLRGTCTNNDFNEYSQTIFVSNPPQRVFIDSINLMLPSMFKNSNIFIELWHNTNFAGRTHTIRASSYPIKFLRPRDFMNGWYFFDFVQFSSNEIFKFVIFRDLGSNVSPEFIHEIVLAPVDIKNNFYPRFYPQIESVPARQDVFIDLYLNY